MKRSDIVERLRERIGANALFDRVNAERAEAAAEIERLRAATQTPWLAKWQSGECVEAVARVLCRLAGKNPDTELPILGPFWIGYRPEARAALLAAAPFVERELAMRELAYIGQLQDAPSGSGEGEG